MAIPTVDASQTKSDARYITEAHNMSNEYDFIVSFTCECVVGMHEGHRILKQLCKNHDVQEIAQEFNPPNHVVGFLDNAWQVFWMDRCVLICNNLFCLVSNRLSRHHFLLVVASLKQKLMPFLVHFVSIIFHLVFIVLW